MVKSYLQRGHYLINGIVISLCLWGPFSWLIFIDYAWNSYHWHWIKLWPILPGLIAGVMFHGNETVFMIVSGLTTLVLIWGLIHLSRRQRYGWLIASVIALCISIPTAYAAYGVYVA